MDKSIVKPIEIKKVTNRYQDVNKSEINVWWNVPGNIEYESNKQKMEVPITERTYITPLLGMDWMKIFKLTIGKIQSAENSESKREKVLNKFPDLFENKKTKKDAEIIIQLKNCDNPIKPKARPVTLHLQEDVGRELEKLIRFKKMK